MKYVLGLDQGGSKTHAIISDSEGNIVGLGKSYGACHSSSSMEYAIGAILEATDAALLQSGLMREDMMAVIGGITGVDWDYEEELLTKEISKYFAHAYVRVVNDCIIAMRAGTMGKHCGILCAGSGLNCAVQSGEERFVYGFYIPDEYQGGTALGKRTVQAVFDSQMGIVDKTILTEMVLQFFSVQTVDELLYWRVHEKITTNDYLKLPILLEEAALKGDDVALDIWNNYGKETVLFLTARMKMMNILDQCVDIVLSGSIFKCRCESFHRTVKQEILKNVPQANIIEAKYEPIVGAALMAIKRLEGKVKDGVYNNLEAASRKFPIKRM